MPFDHNKPHCTRCRKNNHMLETCFYEHGFPTRHRLHGMDFNKDKGQQAKKPSQGKTYYKGKYDHLAGVNFDEEDNTKDIDNSKQDGIYITKEDLASLIKDMGQTKVTDQTQTHTVANNSTLGNNSNKSLHLYISFCFQSCTHSQ